MKKENYIPLQSRNYIALAMKKNGKEGNWKDYLIESILIVFSVLLALFLTEGVNKLHERKNTEDLLKNVVNELKNDKAAITEMQAYNKKVLERIDSALADIKVQESIVSNGEFHLNVIAPDGVLYRYLDDAAWTIAKNNNIISKIDVESVSKLNKVYDDMARIEKVEDEVAHVVFDRNSRDLRQIRTTLIVIRDIFHGWAIDRVPGLINRMDIVIARLESKSTKNQKRAE